jgi:hypothetical protein
MPRINRSKGTTVSEQYVARLADRSFLNLWSYPNVYRETMVNGRRAGKELCDLLVVCGNHIIIFSVKNIAWYESKEINIAWPRWYNRAIGKSVTQIRRAERWITQYPDRIFLDSACTQSFPIPIPPEDARKMYGVVIALGAHKACSEFFGGDEGSFIIAPHLTGQAHADPNTPEYSPFTIGDVDPDGSFIHVVNDVTMDIVIQELDTITDFTDYLDRKTAFIRSGKLGMAAGEEELLAYYLTHLDTDKKHGFPHPDNRPFELNEFIAFDKGFYAAMISNPQYIRKKEADRDSYMWDHLIEVFTENMLAGTTLVPDGSPFELSKHERAVRHMAMEPRLLRRILSNGILGLLEIAKTQGRNFRTLIPPPETPRNRLGYVFLMLAHPNHTLDGGYEQYRQARINMLYTYCSLVLYKYPHLKTIIGIATEPPPDPEHPAEFSEDMILIDAPAEWTTEHLAELERLRAHFDILKEDRIRTGYFHGIEYPNPPVEQKNDSG